MLAWISNDDDSIGRKYPPTDTPKTLPRAYFLRIAVLELQREQLVAAEVHVDLREEAAARAEHAIARLRGLRHDLRGREQQYGTEYDCPDGLHSTLPPGSLVAMRARVKGGYASLEMDHIGVVSPVHGLTNFPPRDPGR